MEMPEPVGAVYSPSPGGIAKIERVPLREVWRHEAYNLTTWLEENIDVLNDVLDLQLTNVEREQAAGSFSADLVAEDTSGGTVVIENQLERSDHDHLGKLITYVSFVDARAAVWIVADPRPEHVRAVSWLNEGSSSDFYLLTIEGIRIAESPPAPLLTLIVGPSAEGREVGEAKKDRADRYHVRRRFWTGLLEHAKTKTRLHAAVSPGEYSWVGAGAGTRGLSFNYGVTQHATSAELYIDRGRDAEVENEQIFDALAARKDAIEDAFGGTLSWERLEGKRACRIAKRLDNGGYKDEARWPAAYEETVDAMARLERALRPRLNELSV
jgi:Domain of unknown function (DUF4268)